MDEEFGRSSRLIRRCLLRDQAQGRGMLRLIEADLASAGKPHLRYGAPSLLLNCGALNALLREGGHLGLQIVAHEIEFLGNTIFIGRVERGLCRWQGEDQPAMTRIHGPEPEHITEE